METRSKVIRKRKKIYSLIISIICFVIILLFNQLNFFKNFEKKTYDYRMKISPNRKLSDKVVIVFIGDRTMKLLGYPVPRDHYAALIHVLKEFGASEIVFDIFFGENNHNAGDKLFVDWVKQAENVFVPIYFYLSREDYLRNYSIPEDYKTPAKSENMIFYERKSGLYRAVNVYPPYKALQNACKGIGHVNVNPDIDGITRRLPLLIEYNSWIYPSLGFAVASSYLGLKNNHILIDYGKKINISLPGDKPFSIPINKKGEMYINYSKSIDNFENYSLVQILQSYKEYMKTDNPAFFDEIDLRTFKDKIVIIGLTALGTHDFRSTPLEVKYASVGIHANIIDSILTKRFYYDAPMWLNLLISLLITLCVGYMIPRYTFRKSIIFLMIIYTTMMVVIFLSFMFLGVVVHMFFPTLALFLSILVISMFLLRYEEIDKLHSEKEKLNITRKLWEKEKQLHSIYDKLFDKENHLQETQEELKKALDESSQQKNEYLEKIKRLSEEKDKLINQQMQINQNKELLENQLIELETQAEEVSEENQLSREKLNGEYNFIIGKSKKLVEVLQVIDKAAPNMANVMITGNTGTGKELLAKAIHQNSPRAKQSFIAVNCAAIPRDLIEGELFGFEKGAFTGAVKRHMGKFEQANGGTIFLDEIGDMSLDTQSKVLRAIQEKIITRVGGKEDIQIDVRIITATHKNLKEEIEAKNFRADLFFRLNVIPVYLPSLTERKEDIPLLAEHFIEKYKKQMKIERKIRIDSQAMQSMFLYHWPGNIREFENMVERILTLKENEKDITIEDLPSEITGKSPHFEIADSLYSYSAIKEAVEEFERRFIVHKLNQFNWNKSKTADFIQLGRRNLHKKIEKYSINEEQDRIKDIEF